MSDVLIRDVPYDVLAGIDARAARLGLSRTQYLRRRLAQDALVASGPVTVGDLRSLSETVSDLADASTMADAWR